MLTADCAGQNAIQGFRRGQRILASLAYLAGLSFRSHADVPERFLLGTRAVSRGLSR